MKRSTFPFWPLWCAVVTACVDLSPAGSAVRLVPEEERESLSACTMLGEVSASSEQALRNLAADQSGDSALMQWRSVAGSRYLRGVVYRCAASAAPAAPATAPRAAYAPSRTLSQEPSNPSSSGEPPAAGKPERCRMRGGRWDGEQCVLDLD